VDQGRDDVLEHDPVSDPATVTTPRMACGELRPFGQQRRELDPDGFEQRGWDGRHESSGCHRA
jgi:hypothetical protein